MASSSKQIKGIHVGFLLDTLMQWLIAGAAKKSQRNSFRVPSTARTTSQGTRSSIQKQRNVFFNVLALASFKGGGFFGFSHCVNLLRLASQCHSSSWALLLVSQCKSSCSLALVLADDLDHLIYSRCQRKVANRLLQCSHLVLLAIHHHFPNQMSACCATKWILKLGTRRGAGT